MEPETKELTQAEKQEMIERLTDLITNNIINRDDRKHIYCVCLAACGREMARMKEENA